MEWNKYEKRLDLADGECKLFAFCGFGERKSKTGKNFEIIKLDGVDGSQIAGSFWIPVFAVDSSNLSPEQARIHKGNVEVSAQSDRYHLLFAPL